MALTRKVWTFLAATALSIFWISTLAEARQRSTNKFSDQKVLSKLSYKAKHASSKFIPPSQERMGKAKDEHHIKHDKDLDRRGNGEKMKRDGDLAAMADVVCGPGGAALRCPSERPCCSRWGFCGSSESHCQDGCQPAFGQCGNNVRDPGNQRIRGKKRRPKRHGFDLTERRRMLPNQDGTKFRIPRTVPKLPTDDTLVNIAYFTGWTQFRGQGRSSCHQRPYLPSSIPWSSLDYVMFAFAYFDDDGKLYPSDPSDEDLYFDINRLKMPTSTRVMISIGGWSFTHPDSKRDKTKHQFKNMIRSRSARKAFIDGCIEFCQFYGFDGVDIDYEYPAYRDRKFVTALFKEMRQAFDDEGSGLVLSLAGASSREGIQGFELDKVSQYTDFIMIMAYDLYGSFDSSRIVNIHTALVQMPTETHNGHSVQGAVELYLDQGVPRGKIVLGLALYGKTFVLVDASETHPGKARFSAGGDPTSCIETRGDMAYNEIANLIHLPHREGHVQDSQSARPQWDPDGRAFYFVYGDSRKDWVGYDDRPSLDLKLQLVTELGLAGVMWWSLDQDLDMTSQEAETPLREKIQVQPRAIPQVPFIGPHIVPVGVEDVSTATLEGGNSSHPTITQATTLQEFIPASTLNSSTALSTTTSALQTGVPLGPIKESSPAGCPSIDTPPAWMRSISLNALGMPGLVPYVASKRKRCSVVIQYPHVLPETPVGNVVLARCPTPDGCSESWQAFTCTRAGWSTGSPCYDKNQLSPSLYFYGELELVRTTTRDRNDKYLMEEVEPSRASYKMASRIGPKRPQYIAQYLKLSKMLRLLTLLRKSEKEVPGRIGLGLGGRAKRTRRMATKWPTERKQLNVV